MGIKLFFRSIICLLTGVFVYGCIVINGHSFNAETINGSGTIISEEREVPVFNQIRLEGSGKVILSAGKTQQVLVNTDDNIIRHIETEVKNGKLIISHDRNNLKPTRLRFHITAANLAGVSISGSGDIAGNEEYNSERFYADIAGSGDISIKVSAHRLESNISGSGSIYLSGSSNTYDARITGSGDVDAFDLQTRDSSVVITGSGNCRVSAADKLQAKITGSGDVLYKGHPRISQSITGSGKVKARN